MSDDDWTPEREAFWKKLEENEQFWRRLAETCHQWVAEMVDAEFKKVAVEKLEKRLKRDDQAP